MGFRFICVYGPSGSGKSTVSREIGRLRGLPVIELDAIYHARPGWDDLPDEEFREAVAEVLAQHPDGWVVDGNYSMVRDVVLPRADAVVWLRLPFRVVYPRLVRRTLRRASTGEQLWGANRETWRQVLLSRNSMLWWGIKSWRPHHARTAAALMELPADVARIELRSQREVAGFLRGLRPPF